MGCCSAKVSKKVRSDAAPTSPLSNIVEDTKEKVIKSIKELQELIIESNNNIESFVIDGNKSGALLFKKIKFCIRCKQENLNELVSQIDEYLENDPKNQRKKLEIIRLYQKITTEINNEIIFSRFLSKNIDQDTEHKINQEIKKYNVNIIEVEKEVDNEFKAHGSNPSEIYTRRKYKKQRLSLQL